MSEAMARKKSSRKGPSQRADTSSPNYDHPEGSSLPRWKNSVIQVSTANPAGVSAAALTGLLRSEKKAKLLFSNRCY
jgi:hypothetical protein